MRLSRSVLAAVLASTLGLGLAACGSDEDPSASQTADTASTSVSSDESSSSDASEEPSAGAEDAADDSADDSGGGSVDVDGFLDELKSGYGDSGSARMAMRMAGGPSAVSVVGDMSYGKAGTAMRVRTAIPGMAAPGVVLVTGGKAYMSMPGVTAPGKFFAVPAGSPLLQGITQGPGSLSLDQSFAAFDGALEKVRSLGPDDIDGTSTQHYKLWVDSKKSLRASGMADTPAGRAALGALPPSLVYDLWLDGDKHMRRMTFAIPPLRVTMDITRWGEPVTVDPPAASDIVAAPPGVDAMQ